MSSTIDVTQALCALCDNRMVLRGAVQTSTSAQWSVADGRFLRSQAAAAVTAVAAAAAAAVTAVDLHHPSAGDPDVIDLCRPAQISVHTDPELPEDHQYFAVDGWSGFYVFKTADAAGWVQGLQALQETLARSTRIVWNMTPGAKKQPAAVTAVDLHHPSAGDPDVIDLCRPASWT